MDLLTSSVYQAMRHRVARANSYATRSEQLQHRQLQYIVSGLIGTEYARKHGYKYKGHRDLYSTYCKHFPITGYEPIRRYVERMIEGEEHILFHAPCKRFAMSSGTSGGRSKYIPVPNHYLQKCHFRGGSDALWLYLAGRPDSEFFKHKGLVIGGSSKPMFQGKDALVGDLSSILVEKLPALGNMIRVPGKKVLLMDEWNAKMKAIVNEVRKEDVGSLSGVPSWMLVMIKQLLDEEKKNNLSEIWPNLEVFFHGGISFEHYRDIYKELIPSPKMTYRETYNASEGFFGIQNDPNDSAMLLMLDYRVFYEFVPIDKLEDEEPQAIPLSEVQTGVTYAMIISTTGGLYRYDIGDTVCFTSTNPYKFKIVGRTTHYINAFGEELMVANTDKAIATVCREMNAKAAEYTAAPLYMTGNEKGRHEWIIEFSKEPNDFALFAQRLDQVLREVNSDYDAKRYSDMTLLPLRLHVAEKGFFNKYMAEIEKLGGQNKVPRLQNNRKLIEQLLQRPGLTCVSQ